MTTGTLSLQLGGSDVPVTVIRSGRRKRTISIQARDGAVVVRAPVRVSNAYILDSVRERARWVLERLAAPTAVPAKLRDGSELLYRGQKFELRVAIGSRRRARVDAGESSLTVSLPAAAGAAEEAVRSALVGWYRARASEVLPVVVAYWATTSGLQPRAVRVREQKRRWGSCGADGTIRLNWRLVMAAPEVADYVVVHELAHLRHGHHQPAFWAEVERIMPDYRERQRELRKLGPMLAV